MQPIRNFSCFFTFFEKLSSAASIFASSTPTTIKLSSLESITKRLELLLNLIKFFKFIENFSKHTLQIFVGKQLHCQSERFEILKPVTA